MTTATEDDWQAIIANVARVAELLVRVREERGAVIHLDIEPEPDCSIENTEETLDFFERRLLPHGAPMLAGARGVGIEQARADLLNHIRICFDCCHFAVEFEDAAAAMARFRAAGIQIGRIQLSSALDVRVPEDPAAARETIERLRPFADATYLHQVVERQHGRLRRFHDLPDALAGTAGAGAREWRIHFHVPLFTSEYDVFGSTQRYVASVLRHVRDTAATRHLEIETYTWDVLPPGLKLDLLESIAREYDWVLDVYRTAGDPASGSEPRR